MRFVLPLELNVNLSSPYYHIDDKINYCEDFLRSNNLNDFVRDVLEHYSIRHALSKYFGLCPNQLDYVSFGCSKISVPFARRMAKVLKETLIEYKSLYY